DRSRTHRCTHTHLQVAGPPDLHAAAHHGRGVDVGSERTQDQPAQRLQLRRRPSREQKPAGRPCHPCQTMAQLECRAAEQRGLSVRAAPRFYRLAGTGHVHTAVAGTSRCRLPTWRSDASSNAGARKKSMCTQTCSTQSVTCEIECMAGTMLSM